MCKKCCHLSLKQDNVKDQMNRRKAMKKMTKFLSVLLCVAMLLTLAACGNTTPSTNGTTPTTGGTKPTGSNTENKGNYTVTVKTDQSLCARSCREVSVTDNNFVAVTHFHKNFKKFG